MDTFALCIRLGRDEENAEIDFALIELHYFDNKFQLENRRLLI